MIKGMAMAGWVNRSGLEHAWSDETSALRIAVYSLADEGVTMSILDMISGPDSAAVQQLATQFGLTQEQAKAAMSALLPQVTAGLQREVSTSEGETGLAAALASGRHETFLAQPELLADPATTLNGNGVLGH